LIDASSKKYTLVSQQCEKETFITFLWLPSRVCIVGQPHVAQKYKQNALLCFHDNIFYGKAPLSCDVCTLFGFLLKTKGGSTAATVGLGSVPKSCIWSGNL
jgi:hypothetical protein